MGLAISMRKRKRELARARENNIETQQRTRHVEPENPSRRGEYRRARAPAAA